MAGFLHDRAIFHDVLLALLHRLVSLHAFAHLGIHFRHVTFALRSHGLLARLCRSLLVSGTCRDGTRRRNRAGN